MTADARERTARIARGDWQTPLVLAEAVLELPPLRALRPRTILEPTCGAGAFLLAASRRHPRAALRGWDIDPAHVAAARRALTASASSPSSQRARIARADFFTVRWEKELAAAEEPLLVVGNPPWVTSAQLGALGVVNDPPRNNDGHLRGLDAQTGKSNFDVSEWMILRLLEAMVGRRGTLAVLCKAAVARKVIEAVARRRLEVAPVGMWRVDAREHFRAAVDAVLFVAETSGASSKLGASEERLPRVWPLYASLTAPAPVSALGVVDGVLTADAAAFARTRHLAGASQPEWRSGLKHDCARVMELERSGSGAWKNGLGEDVDVEEELLHPLLKSSDVANERRCPTRAVIVPQRALGEDTRALRRSAPRAWRYLWRHRALLAARKSAIYAGQPPFAIFGIGPYSFAPWKVAISGLYKRSAFALVPPHEGRPVVLDDTCYFLAFDGERAARRAAKALGSPLAREFLEARIFWDAKRPITKAVLQALDLRALERALERRARR